MPISGNSGFIDRCRLGIVEKVHGMDRGEKRECELERELDSLYRKVAGLDQTGDDRQAAVETRPGRKRRRRFRAIVLGGGFFSILLFLGVVAVLWRGSGVIAPLLKADRAEGTGSSREKESRRSPADVGIIALTAEETRVHSVGPEPGTAPTIGGPSPAAGLLPGDRKDRYAIQIRAYPEDQKQNALTFLEDVRKRARDVTMETVSIAGRGVWHRILLGDFSTIEEAAEYQKSDSVAREHPYGFIQRKYGSGPVAFPAPISAGGEPPA
jgi:hypothetical protein